MKLKYCTDCGQELSKLNETEYSCDNSHIFYNNPKCSVGVLIIRDNKVLIAKRGREPRKGAWDTVGGFVDYMEDPYEAAYREVMEETGLQVKITELIDVATTHVEDDTSTTNIIFLAEIIGNGEPKPDDDVADLVWFDIDKLPTEDLGFSWMSKMSDILRDKLKK